MEENGLKWVEMGGNGWKWVEMDENGWKWMKIESTDEKNQTNTSIHFIFSYLFDYLFIYFIYIFSISPVLIYLSLRRSY